MDYGALTDMASGIFVCPKPQNIVLCRIAKLEWLYIGEEEENRSARKSKKFNRDLLFSPLNLSTVLLLESNFVSCCRRRFMGPFK